jgi:peptide/nickel transport system permease protein
MTAGALWTDSVRVRYLVRRTGRLLVSLLVLLTAAFLMIHVIPGDPVRGALGPTAPADLVAARRESLGLNDPLAVQYLNYLRHLLAGDLGTSMISGLPVSEIMAQRLPATLSIALLAFVGAVAIAVPLGVGFGILTRNGRARRAELGFTSVSSVLGTIPEFLFAVGLVYLFGVQWQILPVAGRSGPDRPRCSLESCASRWSRSSRPTSSGPPVPNACRPRSSTSATHYRTL